MIDEKLTLVDKRLRDMNDLSPKEFVTKYFTKSVVKLFNEWNSASQMYSNNQTRSVDFVCVDPIGFNQHGRMVFSIGGFITNKEDDSIGYIPFGILCTVHFEEDEAHLIPEVVEEHKAFFFRESQITYDEAKEMVSSLPLKGEIG